MQFVAPTLYGNADQRVTHSCHTHFQGVIAWKEQLPFHAYWQRMKWDFNLSPADPKWKCILPILLLLLLAKPLFKDSWFNLASLISQLWLQSSGERRRRRFLRLFRPGFRIGEIFLTFSPIQTRSTSEGAINLRICRRDTKGKEEGAEKREQKKETFLSLKARRSSKRVVTWLVIAPTLSTVVNFNFLPFPHREKRWIFPAKSWPRNWGVSEPERGL